LTPTGRATVAVCVMNSPERVQLRAELVKGPSSQPG
jgi:hypothetical protein